MKCPLCGVKTKVTRTMTDRSPLIRHRKCEGCDEKFKTSESIVATPLRVSKGGGRKTERFRREKILKVLHWLARTHEIPEQDREEIVQYIEYYLTNLLSQDVVSTEAIAALLFERLSNKHPEAARRFASRYEKGADGQPIFKRADLFGPGGEGLLDRQLVLFGGT